MKFAQIATILILLARVDATPGVAIHAPHKHAASKKTGLA